MKKFYLLFAFVCCSPVLFAQTLFTYGDAAVDKEEFLRAFNKNKNPVTDKEKALREYLDLYTKFKLKVKAAKDLRLDTLPQLQNDLQSFRNQVDESYMNNEQAVNDLVDEAFARSQKDIHVIHFYIAMDEKSTADDTLKAYKAMKELQEKLKDVNAGYEDIAKDISRSNAVTIKASDIGFITVFSIPYEYENIAYNLKTGEAGKPYRAKNGLHLLKVVEERKSVGKWRIAQILLAYPPGYQPLFTKTLQVKADSIFKALQNGADFAAMAGIYSDDKLTYMTGGEMPEFGTGKFEPDFEKEVFKSTKEGALVGPFASAFGLHIVKILKQTPTPTDKSDITYMYDLKQKVLQDKRITGAKERFVKEISSLIGYKRSNAVKDADLFRYADSIPTTQPEATPKKFPISDKVVFSFSKGSVKGSDWLYFIRDFKNNAELYKGENNAALLEKFINLSILDYYKKHLEEYNADFRHQIEEFKDGNVLFEVMERNVWGNAASDTAGLLKHYNENKSKYLWGPSAGVVIFNCNNKTTATAAIAELRKGKNWKQVMADGNNNIQADSGRYEISQLPLAAGAKPVEGLVTEPVTNTADGAAGFIEILKIYDGNQQRTFSEARGLVINDYQNILEERWVNELKKKYPVKVNEAVFQSLLK